MNPTQARSSESFVRVLFEGRVGLSSLAPFPLLSDGRVAQIEELLSQLRFDEKERPVYERLMDWDLLTRPIDWPTPMLARVIRQVGAGDCSAALSAIAHLALGVRLIRAWGTETQLTQFESTQGALCAFALTEASPGSDVSRLQTYAEPTDEGYTLSGTKNWVTNAKWATHFIVVARTAAQRAANKPKLTAFIVPAGDGVRVSPLASDVLPGAGVCEVSFHDVQLTKSDVLGLQGKGFRIVMDGLSEARLFVGAAVLGACVRAYNDTLVRVTARRAFGRAVAKFPSVQMRVSGMLSDILAMESLVHAVSGMAEPGARIDPVERAVVRLAVSRAAARVFDAARELHGAAAYAGELGSARKWADARALTLLDGSDSALESYIFLEGTRELRHRLARMIDSIDVLDRVDAAASLFVDKAMNRFRREPLPETPGVAVAELYEFAARLGAAVETAVRKFGLEIVEQQHTQSRVATIVAELATWSALAARVRTEVDRAGEVGTLRMVEAAALWVHDAKVRILAGLSALEHNDDGERDRVAIRAYADKAYPFDVF